MTVACPDWRALTAHRIDPLGRRGRETDEPAGWTEALAHLDGCPDCRRAALEADPTLLFRRLPALPPPVLDLAPAALAAEVESIRLAVAGMRTARRLAPPPERSLLRRSRHWGAAAGLAIAALSLGATPALRPAPHGIAALTAPRTVRLPAPPANVRLVSDRVPDRVPTIEELNRPAARVYQMDGGENLSVVMIVDERLDV
ncbi:MAG TPA: hypothetical protein VFE33_15440 [Thermoanaerobaculia bacterium]|nr:hypothetical protein [Thermoanaerobaculia bacterium]